MRFALIAILILVVSPLTAQTRADPEAPGGGGAKQEARAASHMVVTANPLATEAGLKVLRGGGSAVDAAIAAQLVLNVVEPQSSGLGGGGFALVHDPKSGETTAYDGRETAPASATPGMFLEADGQPMGFRAAVASGRSVGVPGLPRLLARLHADHGRADWAGLVDPAIALARDGFRVSPRLAGLLARRAERLAATQSAALFLKADGSPLEEGALFVNPDLAVSLSAYARSGAEPFHDGDIAVAIVAAVSADPVPGGMTLADLGAYEVRKRPPVCVGYRDYRVCGMGPPSSGATTVGQIMGMVSHFPMSEWGPNDPRSWSVISQASRLAYADRAAFLADDAFSPVPVRGLLDRIYLGTRAKGINPDGYWTPKAEPGAPPWREGAAPPMDEGTGRPSTTHISVIDGDGLAVSMTTSIEGAFGSGRVAGGFLLNNQLTDFSFRPVKRGGAVANSVAPGKRPRSSMSPTLVFRKDGRLAAIVGSPGGSRIIGYVVKTLIAHLDWDMGPQAAASYPNVSDRNGGSVGVEDIAAADGIAEGLEGMGFPVERRAMTSGVHMIAIGLDGALRGGADPRREGLALGD